MLEVGVNSWSAQSTYMRPRSHQRLYREALEDAAFAESLGFDSFWMGEHHFTYDGYCPSTVALAAHIVAGTERIKLGAGVLLLPLHGSARIADAAAAVNAIAPGRLALAFAPGWREMEFIPSGLRLKDRRRLMEQYMAELVDGEHAERFRGTELWMGGITPAALDRAGRFGASTLMNFGGLDEINVRRSLWQENMRSNPASPPRVGMIRDVWVDTDAQRLEWVRARMREMWRFYTSFGDPPDIEGGVDVESTIDAFMEHTTLGSAQEALEELAPLVTEAKLDTLVLRVRFDGLEPRYVRAALERIATDVVPQLRQLSA